jgi:cytochrome P450
MKMYLVFGQENVSTLFKNSKYLEKDNLTRQAFQNSSATETKPINGAEKTNNSKKLAEIDDAEAARIGRKLHDMQHLLLSQPNEVKVITEKFISSFQNELQLAFKEPTRYGLKEESEPLLVAGPIFGLIKRAMFVASTVSLMGTQILKLNPDLVETYWAYDEAFLLGLPELVYPAGSSARDKLLSAVQKYIEAGHKNYDWDQLDNPSWEEHFGCRLFRSTLKELKDRGIAIPDQANAIVSLVWATASNSVPLTTWMLMTFAQDSKLALKVRSELAKAVIEEGDSFTLNIGKLSTPLLQSVYLESLRLRTSVTVTRRLTADVVIGGYLLKKDHYVMAPSYLAHTSNELWEPPNSTDSSAKSFQPDRFSSLGSLASSAGEKVAIESATSEVKSSTEESDTQSKVETSHLRRAIRPENFFPYGGGNAVCPGRFFSKQKILAAAAIALLRIDFVNIEGAVESDGVTKMKLNSKGLSPDERYAGGGVMPPDGDLIVKMKWH